MMLTYECVIASDCPAESSGVCVCLCVEVGGGASNAGELGSYLERECVWGKRPQQWVVYETLVSEKNLP